MSNGLSKKEAKRASKAAQRAQKALRSATGSLAARVNNTTPTLPLAPDEEQLRQALIAGDFFAANALLPFGPSNWLPNTRLDKFRLNAQGQRVPFSEADKDRFMQGPWVQPGGSLVHPRRRKPVVGKALTRGRKRLSKGIYPGRYLIPHAIDSTWTKVREPVVGAALVATTLAFVPGAAGAAGKVGGAALKGAKKIGGVIAGTAKKVVGFANDNTGAIVAGTAAPPPNDVGSQAFTSWATDVAVDLAQKEMQRKLTRDEQRQLQREIERMQQQTIAAGAPRYPQVSSNLNPELQRVQQIPQKQAVPEWVLPAAIVGGLLLFKGGI